MRHKKKNIRTPGREVPEGGIDSEGRGRGTKKEKDVDLHRKVGVWASHKDGEKEYQAGRGKRRSLSVLQGKGKRERKHE